jgi:hypothetical protein
MEQAAFVLSPTLIGKSIPSSRGYSVPELHAALQSQGFQKFFDFMRTKKIDRPGASRG